MKVRSKTSTWELLSVLLLLFFSLQGHSQTENKSAANDGTKFFFEGEFATNYVEQGITQTESDPHFGGNLGYLINGQFLFSLGAGNVHYGSESVQLNLRPTLGYKMNFTTNADLMIKVILNRFYKETGRNGMLIDLDLNLFGYHVLYLKNDNWEGTYTESSYLGFVADWPLGSDLLFKAELGYQSLSAVGVNSYFHSRASLGYKINQLLFALQGTWTSATDLGGKAGPFLFLTMQTKF